MGRTIKFRGRDIETDEWVCGDLLTNSHGGRCISSFRTDGKGRCYSKVDPNSVEQLIGVDKNGVEVYEGDFCKANGAICPFMATFDHYSAIRDGQIIKKVEE